MTNIDTTRDVTWPDENDLFMRLSAQMARVQDDQRSLVLVSHGALELIVNNLIEVKCKNAKRITSDTRGYPHSARLLILNEISVISDEQLRQYDNFRKLRNRAAHDPLFAVKAADLAPFADYYREPTLYTLCVAIVASLWNDHIPELAPLFLPSMVPAIKVEQLKINEAR